MAAGIAMIIPCFNEEKRLDINAFLAFAHERPGIDLWFCNDGSTDGTVQVIEGLMEKNPVNIFLYNSNVNRGKAETIRRAMQHLEQKRAYQMIGFIDADLSAPLSEIDNLLMPMLEHNLIMAAGARVKLVGKLIRRNMVRYYLGRIFTTYYDTLLRLTNYDTQCGLKIFRSDIVPVAFAVPFNSKWFFDVEIFLRIQHHLGRVHYGAHVWEIPLDQWIEIKGSKLKLKDFLVAPFEILKIYFKYRKQIQQ